ncbi:hypothetical protein D1871_09710 [Nakamurella silvestris]|nr:hypothetical protein D1871_09710 [Nakamurella silvestris]
MDAAGAALAQTRSMVQVEGGEGPEGASDAGEPLTEALHRLLGTADQLGLVTSLTVDGDTVHLPNAIAVPLLRIAQEALSNVVVHAGARRVAMTLTFQPDTVTLDVVDDGRGFDPADPTPSATAGTGLGLSAMRSRIEELGGTLTVETRRRGTGTGAGAAENPPGSSGTAIGATLPLGRANAAGSAGPLSTAPPAPVDNEPADTEPADTGPPWTVPAGGHR